MDEPRPPRPPLAKVIEHPRVRADRFEAQADALADALEELIESCDENVYFTRAPEKLGAAIERARVMLRAARGGKRFPTNG